MKFTFDRLSLLVAIIFSLSAGAFARAEAVNYFRATPGALAQTRTRLAANDPSLQPALKALIQAANQALKTRPPSVVEKGKMPPSGDRHDYLTLAPYYWPDPSKPNGLPYLRRDGRVNPESRTDNYDHGRIESMAGNVETLALAYYFTGHEAYAAHAADFLRTWFISPASRMNPNLKFAQAVPGENTGRDKGILEGRNLSQAADAAGLLAGSPAWSTSDRLALRSWLESYLNWLLTSDLGRAEAASKNNHGTWYDVQAVELALVLGQTGLARQICAAAPSKRFAIQIELDGRQPLELERTASFSYSCFNLDALFTLATLAEYQGVDLWHEKLSNGRIALRGALDFLLPFAISPAPSWPYEQISSFDRAALAPELHMAAEVYHAPEYARILATFPHVEQERFQLLYK